MSGLTQTQRKLETGLLAHKRGLFDDPITNRRKQVAERDALVQLVNHQATELDQLRVQINALRRKDTSLYS